MGVKIARSVSTLSLLHSVLLGLIQGVAEFLPISSSGHLAIAEHLLGQAGAAEIPGFFDVLLHLGTLFAVFAAYWEDIRDMVVEFFGGVGDLVHGTTPTPVPAARRLIFLIVVGTLPLFAVLPVKDLVEGLGDNMYFVAGALLATGCLLFASDRVRKGRKTERTASLADVLLVGVAQAVATCPGISRSGTTITAGCFVGFERKFAVRFSFLLSIPAILGANILSLKDALEAGVPWEEVPVYLLGVLVAAVVGYACIRLLKMIAERGKFGFFAYYCWLAGAVTLALTLLQK
jgi:undecaprenyl-diphosphatase